MATIPAPPAPDPRRPTRIVARPDRRAYGMGLGIILLDDVYPGFPGDVRDASGWPYPVQYDVAEGVDIFRLVDPDQPDRDSCFDAILASARRLERLGCRAIAAECGFFCYFQRRIADAVSVPVFMSSLLQVPFAQQLVGPDRAVGILMANANYLTERHLTAVGIQPGSNYVVGDAMAGLECEEFDHLWTGGLRTDPPAAEYAKAEREFVGVATRFVRQHPHMAALVLECTGFPPFARSLQREIDMPVFSWGTLLDYAYSVAVHRDYYGHV